MDMTTFSKCHILLWEIVEIFQLEDCGCHGSGKVRLKVVQVMYSMHNDFCKATISVAAVDLLCDWLSNVFRGTPAFIWLDQRKQTLNWLDKCL